MNIYKDVLQKFKEFHLFRGVPEEILTEIIQTSQEKHVTTEEFILREGDVQNELFFIYNGAVDILKKVDHNKLGFISHLVNGDFFGEMSLIEKGLCSASVKATMPTTLYVIKIEQLLKIMNAVKTEQSLLNQILANAAYVLSTRLRKLNDVTTNSFKNLLEESQARNALGNVLIAIIVMMSLYSFMLGFLYQFAHSVPTTTLISLPVIFVFALAAAAFVKISKYPPSLYGLTLANWRESLIKSTLLSIPLLILILFFKWVMIRTVPMYHHVPLFEAFDSFHSNVPHAEKWLGIPLMLGYILFVPLQEFMVRGVLQGGLTKFLSLPHKTLLAIISSNLLFSEVHLLISLKFACAVFLPGLFWGWLYAKYRSLVGVIVSHILIGVWALYIVGFRSILVI